MRDLFTSINHDSTKNQFYIKCDTFEQIKISEFMKLMQLYYKDYFAKKKTDTGKRKTLEEFRDELIKTNYFKNDKEAQTLFVEIDNKNKEFYNLNRYEITMNQNQGIFYKDELNCLQDGVIISLKNNNFIDNCVYISNIFRIKCPPIQLRLNALIISANINLQYNCSCLLKLIE